MWPHNVDEDQDYRCQVHRLDQLAEVPDWGLGEDRNIHDEDIDGNYV